MWECIYDGQLCEVVIKSSGQEWWISGSMITSCGFIHSSAHFSAQTAAGGGRGGWKAGPGGCKSAVSWTPVSPHDNMAYILQGEYRKQPSVEMTSSRFSWGTGMDSCLYGWIDQWVNGKGQTDMNKKSKFISAQSLCTESPRTSLDRWGGKVSTLAL